MPMAPPPTPSKRLKQPSGDQLDYGVLFARDRASTGGSNRSVSSGVRTDNPSQNASGTISILSDSPSKEGSFLDLREVPEHGNEDRRPSITSVESVEEQCDACGNIFMPDAVFCRKCGEKRPQPDLQFGDTSLPVWNWSRGDIARGGERFRFLDRHAVFWQSRGHWNVRRVASEHSGQLRKLYMLNKYHSFIDGGGLMIQVAIYAAVYVLSFLVFAVVNLLISEKCGLRINGKFVRAYYLAVESMVTIGYGLPDPYYNNCWEGTVALTLQCLVAYFWNALVIGSVFLRMTRPQSRAATVLFSDKAVIQQINGSFYFMFRLCEAKHHDLVQAHVRCYCIRHDRKGEKVYSVVPMRLQQPDDDHGAQLMLTLPTKVIHRIDNWSPLSPLWNYHRHKRSGHHASVKAPSLVLERAFWAYSYPEVPMRQVDADQGDRDTCVCTVCGSSFAKVEQLRRHMEYNAIQDELNEVPMELRHTKFSKAEMRSWGWTIVDKKGPESPPSAMRTQTFEEEEATAVDSNEEEETNPVVSADAVSATRADMYPFLTERFLEVVVLVEGVEPTTSGICQARHSYLFPEDVLWDMDFEDCTTVGTDGSFVGVDLSRFHKLIPAQIPSNENVRPSNENVTTDIIC